MNKYKESLEHLKTFIGYTLLEQYSKKDFETLEELVNNNEDELYSRMLCGTNCLLLDLYVYDKDYKVSHKVGTDSHDAIYTSNNDVYYYNLQNGCGCSIKHSGSSYKFIENPEITKKRNKQNKNAKKLMKESGYYE